jgi:hypothetical protein
MRVSECVSSVVRSAALGDLKDFNVVLSQEGRAKNPALLIFCTPAWPIIPLKLKSANLICHKSAQKKKRKQGFGASHFDVPATLDRLRNRERMGA